MAKICLIAPPLVAYDRDIFGAIPSPPVGLAILAAHLRKAGHLVRVVDAFAANPYQAKRYASEFVAYGLTPAEVALRVEPDCDLVGVSLHSWMAAGLGLEICREVKARLGLKIAIGGPCVSTHYRELFGPGVDFAILGEGEVPLAALLEAFEAGQPVKPMPGLALSALDDPGLASANPDPDPDFPAWDLVRLEPYHELKMNHSPFKGRFAPLITSRGCPYDCAFCTTPQVSARKWRAYPAKRVVEEIVWLYNRFGVSDIFIQDDNFTVDVKRARAICQGLRDLGLDIRLSLPSGVRLDVMNAELVAELAQSGFTYLCLAPESGSAKVRARMRKELDEPRLYEIQKACRARKLRTGAFFIIGTPGEEFKDLLDTARMIIKLMFRGLDDVSIFIYAPLPGSGLAGYFPHPLPPNRLGLCWSPRWRPDYRKLARARLGLYALYCACKLLFQPLSGFKHLYNIFTRRFETKGEMGAARLLAGLWPTSRSWPGRPE